MVTTKIDDALKGIATKLDEFDYTGCGPGLLTGKGGIALFFFYYSRHTNNQIYATKALELILDVFKSIQSGFNFPTYCDGIAGYAWLVEHLVKNDFILRDDVPFLDELDPIICKQSMLLVKSKDCDFLHGSLGMAYYLLNRVQRKECQHFLNKYIYELEKLGISSDSTSIKWMGAHNKNEENGCDLGFAHGMSAIVIFLSKVVQIMPQHHTAIKLLEQSSQYILSNQLNPEIYFRNFPDVIFANNIELGRKIGWCYGDLPPAVAILRAGKALKNQEMQDRAIKILINTTKIKELNIEDADDIGLCHGMTGISHIYNRIFQDTSIEDFKLASTFWQSEVFRLLSSKSGVLLNKHLDKSDRNVGLLVGTAGVGLSLISATFPERCAWDECILLS